MKSHDDVSSAVAVGACRALLIPARRWVSWHGTLEGRLVLEGGEREQPLRSCQVSLLASLGGSDGSSPTDVRSWRDRIVCPGERLELPFTLKMAWGASLGPTASLQATVYRRPAFLEWPSLLSCRIEVTPPLEFVHAAAVLAELTGFEPGIWSVIAAGDGAAIPFESQAEGSPVSRVGLQLFRAPERDYGELRIHPHSGRARTVTLHLPRGRPDAVRAALLECLEPVLRATEALPIPSQPRAAPEGQDLPLPAGPSEARENDLPRPSGGPPGEADFQL